MALRRMYVCLIGVGAALVSAGGASVATRLYGWSETRRLASERDGLVLANRRLTETEAALREALDMAKEQMQRTEAARTRAVESAEARLKALDEELHKTKDAAEKAARDFAAQKAADDERLQTRTDELSRVRAEAARLRQENADLKKRLDAPKGGATP